MSRTYTKLVEKFSGLELELFTIYFLFLIRKSVHASIITAVKVVSLSNAYCFNCLTKLLGRSHVVLTFIGSFLDMQYHYKRPYIQ
jgi:hypothetical protein